MSEKRLTAYELGQEWTALVSLINDLTDPETGETRELTEAEKAYLTEQIDKLGNDIKTKIDGICKVFKNIKMEAEIAEAEKNALKGEIDRLSKRAKARINEADRVKMLACYLLDKIGEKKIKTDLFTVYYQATQKGINEIAGFYDPEKIPSEYIKKELNKEAVKEAVKEGRLYEKETPQDKGKLFYMENGIENYLYGVSYIGGETLIIK